MTQKSRGSPTTHNGQSPDHETKPPELLGALGCLPTPRPVPSQADLGDQDQVGGVGVQRLVDQLVGDIGTVCPEASVTGYEETTATVIGHGPACGGSGRAPGPAGGARRGRQVEG